MSETGGLQGVNLSDIGLNTPLKPQKDKSEKNEFLQLFVTQLRNQNPLEPRDGAEYLGQLAQFSTLEGIRNMETAFNKIANSLNSNQALQASTLVGKNVEVKTDNGLYMQGSNVKGSINVPDYATNVQMEIRNEQGEVIRTVKMNAAQRGELGFVWDGLDDGGNAQPSGVYRFVAKADIQGTEKQIDTYISANVDSVTINKNGQPVTLNVSGYGRISIDDIKTIS
ncbi:MAG: flagellar hook assembly protein FlgD [Candidatus Berkiella sp.]